MNEGHAPTQIELLSAKGRGKVLARGQLVWGFSLLEALVAIAIIMLAIAGAFGLAPEGISGARAAKNQTMATYFAMEGIEVVRAIRDDNMFYDPNPNDSRNWVKGLTDCMGQNANCTVNAFERKVYPCPRGRQGCPFLQKFDDTIEGTIYGNGGVFDSVRTAEDTIFKRSINLRRQNNIGGPVVEYLVTATVVWNEGGRERQTVVTTSIFDWWTIK